MRILITGGAGYIGSVVVERLLENGYNAVVVDNLSIGHREAVPENVPLYVHDCGDLEKMRQLFSEQTIDVVMHFAASALVGESVQQPQQYFQNNVTQTLNLLLVMREFGCDKFILSSSAATFITKRRKCSSKPGAPNSSALAKRP